MTVTDYVIAHTDFWNSVQSEVTADSLFKN